MKKILIILIFSLFGFMFTQDITNSTQENCGEVHSGILKDLSEDKLAGLFCDGSKHDSVDFSNTKDTDGSLDNLKKFLNSFNTSNTSKCLDC